MSPYVKLGLDLIVAVANAVPEISRFVARAIEAARDTDDGPMADYVEEKLAGAGHSAAMSAEIRRRNGG